MNNIDIDPEIDTVPVRAHAAARNSSLPRLRARTEPWNPNPSPLPLARFPARRDLSHLFLQPGLVPQPNNSPEVTH
eukprot:scaffold6971_cov41-Phaeocystis_antarctica.AAC.2